MAESLGEAVLDLSGDTSKLDSDISGLKSRLLTTLGGLGKVGGAILGAGLALAGAGIAVIGNELYKSVQAAMEAEKVQAQLAAVLESTGGVAGMTAEEVNSLATSLSQVTMFEDDAIVAGENLLLTFTNIGEDIFPQATETMLDMSTALGQDLNASAMQLGKALNDPIAGVAALSRVGVQFTDDQKKMIEEMVASGDLLGAQTLILKELETQMGGSARAAGETFAGQMAILKNNLGNVRETIGAALLPALGQLATMFSEYLNKPEVQAFIKDLAQNIADLAAEVVANLPIFIENVKAAFGWFQENEGVIVAALAAIGVAIAAFVYTTVIPAAIAVISSLWPILLIIGLVALAAYFLYEAWTNNWGGIRDSVMELWTVIEPYLIQLRDWLQIGLTIAIQQLANFWTTVLLPAIQAFFAWVSTVAIPAIISLIQWLAVNVPQAIKTLVTWWTNLRTTITAVMQVFKDKVNATIARVVDQFRNFVAQGESMIAWLKGNLTAAFEGVGKAIRLVVGLINSVIKGLEKLANMDMGNFQFSSPPPLEVALRGIGDAMKEMANAQLPTLQSSLSANLGLSTTSGMELNGDSALGSGRGNTVVFNMQKSDLNEDQLQRALLRSEMLYG